MQPITALCGVDNLKKQYLFTYIFTNFYLILKLMKISKLLVLSALWLTATSVKAEVPDGIWTMPEPQGLEFTTFTNDPLSRYYLYNPGAKMFFASGNSWGTQASVRTFGYPFWVEPSTEENAPEGSYGGVDL